MVPAPFLRPDVLVLAGGGIVGEAWMHGLLAGLEDAAGTDFRRVESYVGTSAGSIVAARLVAGRRPPRPGGRRGDAGETAAGPGPGPRAGTLRRAARGAARWGWAATAPAVPLALRAGMPVGAAARAAFLTRVPSTSGRPLSDLHARVGRWGARFDGRLRICCVDRRTGRRVVFGAPGAPVASVADAVVGSCAIPWVFRPAVIGGREYFDGGVWSVTNLDAAPGGTGTHVLCLDPTARLGLARFPVGLAFRAAVALELQLLRRRGARVHHVAPDARAAEAMGVDFMNAGRAPGALTAGYRQGRSLAS